MNFISMVVDLEPPVKEARMEYLQESIHAHAALMSLISAADAELGRRLHDTQRNKPFTLSMFSGPAKRVFLRLTFFGGESLYLAEAATNLLVRTDTLTLGQQGWSVGNIRTYGLPWTAIATWSDILAPSNAAKVTFSFDTLTAFIKKNDRGARIVSKEPDPKTLFRGLAWKWRSIGGEPLPATFDDYLSSDGCVIATRKLKKGFVKLAERSQIGFLGSVTYECRIPDRACITAINRLAKMAYFTGCGYQVCRGMGSVRTELHESPNEVDH